MDEHSNFRTICEDGKGNLKTPFLLSKWTVPFLYSFRQASMGERHSTRFLGQSAKLGQFQFP